MGNEYQYYTIIEIKNGKIEFYKNINPSQRLKNFQYKSALSQAYYRTILESAINNKVGILSLENSNELFTNYSCNKFGFSYNELIIRLFIAENNNELFANDLPIPTKDGGILKNSERLIRNEQYASSLAIHHYLLDNNSKYLKDVQRVETLINNFYNFYFYSNRIEKIPFLFTSNSKSQDVNNLDLSSVLTRNIDSCLSFNKESKDIFLFDIALYRNEDIYINHGLVEFENGSSYYDYFSDCEILEKPSEYQIALEWQKKSRLWNDSFLNSLKSISLSRNLTFFLKGNFNYPVKNKEYLIDLI